VSDPIEVFRDYLGFSPLGGVVLVNSSDLPGDIPTKVAEVNPPDPPPDGSPAGRGRLVYLPSGRLTTPELDLSQGQSLCGVKGSTILTLESDATLTKRDVSGVGAYITIRDDYYAEGGIAGQGVIEDLDIDAKNLDTATGTGVTKFYGLYAPPRDPDPDHHANLHTIRNAAVYNAKDNGIHFDLGNDKLVCDRIRQEGAGGVGIYLAGGDVKARAVGSASVGTALYVSGAAVEIDQFDLWRSIDANVDQPTLDIVGGANGCVIKSGTVEGWTRFIGKNEGEDPPPPFDPESPAASHYLNSKAQFAFVHFKYSKDLLRADPDPTCYFEAQSADLVELISCKFGVSGTEKPNAGHTYDYLIMITNSSNDASRNGLVKISGGSGMLRYLGRVDGNRNRMYIDALKHICNVPKRLLFDWGRMGTVEIVPNWAVDSSDPMIRTHLRCDGTQYNKVDQPFGYLNVGAYRGANVTLDDGIGTFDMPRLPIVSSDCVFAIRAIP